MEHHFGGRCVSLCLNMAAVFHAIEECITACYLCGANARLQMETKSIVVAMCICWSCHCLERFICVSVAGCWLVPQEQKPWGIKSLKWQEGCTAVTWVLLIVSELTLIMTVRDLLTLMLFKFYIYVNNIWISSLVPDSVQRTKSVKAKRTSGWEWQSAAKVQEARFWWVKMLELNWSCSGFCIIIRYNNITSSQLFLSVSLLDLRTSLPALVQCKYKPWITWYYWPLLCAESEFGNWSTFKWRWW